MKIQRLAFSFLAAGACVFLTSSCGQLGSLIEAPGQEWKKTSEDWRKTEAHGKSGLILETTLSPVGVVAALALSPVTYATAFALTGGNDHGDNGFAYGILVSMPYGLCTDGGYYLGASIGYPIYLCSIPFDENAPSGVSDDAKILWLIRKMPRLNERGYDALVRVSQRDFSPQYESEGKFGYKKTLPSPIVEEWRTWYVSGRPNGLEERRFAMRYWLFDKTDTGMGAYFQNRVGCVMEKCAGETWDAVKAWENERPGSAKRIARTNASLPQITSWRAWVDAHGGVDAVAKAAEARKPSSVQENH